MSKILINMYYMSSIQIVKYPVSGRIFFRYPANPVSGRIVKITIRCTPREGQRKKRAREKTIELTLFPFFQLFPPLPSPLVPRFHGLFASNIALA
jgi:hypothetical protein